MMKKDVWDGFAGRMFLRLSAIDHLPFSPHLL